MISKDAFKKAQKAAEDKIKPLRLRAPKLNVNCFVDLRKKDNGVVGEIGVIYFVLRAKGSKRVNFSSGIRSTRADFNTKTLQIAGRPEDTTRLINFKEDLHRVFNERCITGRSLYLKIILQITLGLRGHDETIPSVIEGITVYLHKKEQLLGNGLAQGTIKRYRGYQKILFDFIAAIYGVSMRFEQLKPSLEYDLLQYLKGKKKYDHNYALKIFQFFRSILEYAVAHEWTDRNVIRHVRLYKEKKSPITLTMDDLNQLKAASFVEPNAELVRDIFLFSCYTGMGYADVEALSPAYIVSVNGVQCVIKNRGKSGVQAFTPLFPEAQAILDKYENHPYCRLQSRCLPVLSNAKTNVWLKIIGNTIGIKQRLHTHLARKTFTMYAEELGFTLTEMAVMMGHTSQTMTENFYYQRRQEPVINRFKSIFVNGGDQAKAS